MKSNRVAAVLVCLATAVYPCTIAVVGASVSGRPILWKNRDVPGVHQEVRRFDDGLYAFVADVYEAETDRAWSGVNEAGFGIVNTDTYNQGIWGSSGDDDGRVMFHALGNFVTVDDFQAYLDSTNLSIRRSTHCYGVFDSTGAAAIFEAGRNCYVRYDADDAPGGYLVRTNYADAGEDTNYVGEDRRQRAEQILSSATTIDPHLFLFGLARDLVTDELDPNPLPFEGSFMSYPSGIIETHHTINRYYTSSACVLVGGNGAGMPPTMWQFLGQPIVSMPVPIWVNSGEVAAPLGGPDGSELCDLAIDLKSIVYTGTYTIDTYVLADILDRFEATEDQAFSLAEDRVGSGAVVVPSADELRSLQNEIADMVLEKYWEIRALYVQEKNRGLPQNSSIVVFPNPFNSTGKLHIKTDRCGIADIEIYDTSGRLVAKPAFGMQIYSGDVDIPLVLGKLHSGIYLAVLRMDGRIASSTAFALLK